MSILEEIGESVIRTANKVVYYFLGALIRLVTMGKGISMKTQTVEIYPFFQRRGVDLKDYIVLKGQVATLSFLVVSVTYIFGWLGGKATFIILLIAGGASLVTVFKDVRDNFPLDFEAYRDFFLSYLGISILLIALHKWKPTVNYAFPFLHIFIFSILSIGLVSYMFKKRYGRDYTTGRVMEVAEKTKVKVNYDIRSGVKPGVYTFENPVDVKDMDVVKLELENSFLNLRGKKPTRILDVVTDEGL